MNPDEVWVVYNKFAPEILAVFAEQFLAEQRWQELAEEDYPQALVKNRVKLVTCTLKRALDEMNREHQSAIAALKEEQELAMKYLTY